MVLKEVLNKGIEMLKASEIDTPVIDAGVILCHVLGCDRVFIYAHQEYDIDLGKSGEFFSLIAKRSEGMPVQYITGHQEFMSLDFTVKPGVLIPRQDTETLVEAVITHAGQLPPGPITILDIGTGSGCIAVSLAYYLKNSFVTAVDISDTALETAYLNAANHAMLGRMTFIKSDIFEALDSAHFDIVVSNPPYIPRDEISGLQREVRDYEPELALAGGNDGLYYYRLIMDRIEEYLVPGGLMAVEAGLGQSELLTAMMVNKFVNIRCIKDLAGINRVVSGQLDTLQWH
jgi:release factor glutamine methyltransferase